MPRIRHEIYRKLLPKYKIDLWGNFMTKKKYKLRLYKNFLYRFESIIRGNYLRSVQIFAKYYSKSPRNKLPYEKFRYSKKKKINFLKNIFFKNLQIYYDFYNINILNPKNNLFTIWSKSSILKTHSYLYRKLKFYNIRLFISRDIRRAKIVLPDRKLSRTLDFYRMQYYFGFNTTKRFRRYVRLYETSYSAYKQEHFGLEGLLPHILFRVGLFPTIRYCYLLIKLGGLELNSKLMNNPYKVMQLYDSIKIVPPFIKLLFKFFKFRLKSGLVWIPPPNYIDYDFKLMNFFIWRRPTKIERKVAPDFPFVFSPYGKSSWTFPLKLK